jgi:serine/threonine-protein kinase
VPVAAHGTTNPEAYSAYLLGRQLSQQTTIASWREAIETYQQAISLDPRYADAYAGLALSDYYLADSTGDAALKTKAEQAANKAVELDPGLAIGYATRGFLRYTQRFDWAGAESDFKHALELEPTNSRALQRYGSLLARVGRAKDGAAMIRKAIELDPLASLHWQNLGTVLVFLREYPAAYEAFRHALAIRPENSLNKFNLARLQLLDGKTQEALVMAQSISDEAFRSAGVAMAEHTLGDVKASQHALEQLISTSAADSAYQIAEVYAWRGEKDNAFEWLERAHRQQDGGLSELKVDPMFALLLSDPRFVAMLRTLNFPP